MGNHHQDKWRRALPWVLLGKRVAFQPDLDTSAALLAFGRSPLIPGQLLGEPGPPLTSLQVKALLEELYRLENKPALQTSSQSKFLDISETDEVTHVYVKVEEPRGLAPRFEGPFEVTSRPSRSQVQVRVGSYASGEPRLLTYHWSSCKIAHMRQNAVTGSRPKLGRRPQAHPGPVSTSTPVSESSSVLKSSSTSPSTNSSSSADPSAPSEPSSSSGQVDTLSGNKPHPEYVKKGPLVTQRMFDEANWPKILNIPDSTRPTRSTRNPNPKYK